MPQRLLLDPDVLIDYSRKMEQAVAYLRGLSSRPVVSAVTVAEMYAGVRDGEERDNLDRFISESDVVAVDPQIAERGGLILRQYYKSHGTGCADAIIAATAEIERATLVTLNRKHFPMLPDVLVPYQKA
jgi:predicted nucleic acid-binding protein